MRRLLSRKKSLAALAMAFALMVGCGGTVMFLTAETGVALNTMTVGALQVRLFTESESAGSVEVPQEGILEFQHGKILPNQSLEKPKVWVKNLDTSAASAYVYVDLIFSASAVNGDSKSWEHRDFLDDYDGSDPDLAHGLDIVDARPRFLNGVIVGAWVPARPGWVSAGSPWLDSSGFLHAGYFYCTYDDSVVGQDRDLVLAKLPKGEETPPVFYKLVVPSSGASIENLDMSLTAKAYAVQSEYVSVSPDDMSGWIALFEGEISGLVIDGQGHP